MDNNVTISIFQDKFLLYGMNQLINHIDKFKISVVTINPKIL